MNYFTTWCNHQIYLALHNMMKQVIAALESSSKRGSSDGISNCQVFWRIEMGHLTYNNGVVVVGKDVCSSSSNFRNFQSVVMVQKFVRRCGQFLERESRRSSSPWPWSPLEAVLCQRQWGRHYWSAIRIGGNNGRIEGPWYAEGLLNKQSQNPANSFYSKDTYI